MKNAANFFALARNLIRIHCSRLKPLSLLTRNHCFPTCLYLSLRYTLHGGTSIPTFLIISRHSPENCPINNEKMKKLTLELPKKLGTLEKKHDLKRVGVWAVIPEHLTVWVYEAPNSESLQAFSMEPDMIKWMAWNVNEIKLAVTLEENCRLLSKPNMNLT